jgi:hypothetical protein
MIESGSNIGTPHFIRRSLAQVKYALVANIKPVPEAFKRRTLALNKAHNFAVKIPELIQQLTWRPQIVMVEGDRTHAFAGIIIAGLPSL